MGLTEAMLSRGRAQSKAKVQKDFRPDIQGLRALAVLLVVIYHLWPNRLTGGFAGVDVFFVISGFLITSHLLRHPPTTLRDLGTFWARRIRRLLPAALLVLTVSLVITRLIGPQTQWGNWSLDIVAAAAYVVNWRLAAKSVNYLQAESAASPVQHFWSLSVEEQFYLVWPLLIAAVAIIAYKQRWRLRNAVLIVLGVVVAASLAYSIYATAVEPASAYFVTPTRMWELGLGGLLATVFTIRAGDDGKQVANLSLPIPVRVGIAWAGIAAIMITALTYTGATPFPGWRALLPILGTVAVIAVNPPTLWLSPGKYMGWRPVQWVGDVSYSIYLWHWPMIVLLPFVSGDHLGRLDKAAILVASLVLAGLTKQFIEDPFRRPRSRPGHPALLRRPYQFAALGMAFVVVLGGLQVADFNHRQSVAEQQLQKALAGDKPCLGAAAMVHRGKCNPITKKGKVVPAPAQAATDKSEAYPHNCWESAPYAGMKTCTFGDPNGKINIALVGNSHAGEWLGPLDEIAKQKHWKITTYLASECSNTTARVAFDTPEKQTGCLNWASKVMKATSKGNVDLVITADRNSFSVVGKNRQESQPLWEAGYAKYLKQWIHNGVDVAVLHDSPYPGKTMGAVPDCVAENPDDLLKCSGPRSWVPNDPLYRAATKLSKTSKRVSTMNLTDYFCTKTRCPGVIGGVVAYFDKSHISNTYAMTLAPYMVKPLDKVVRKSTG